ncbi:uncharacterized protein HMPREF1541_01363 [Cyphellophora europaea CBS 101466]|uniref:Cyclase n=1 Tax=Cyphellophora europaea (strain CBS 101466) TaxID=1220924 RepID=W2SEP8_CYPE1|nr:uncharacterized protein HMPREF1541_01363 [Cyphellophora europaea CBS 101466]ETN47172.1 hypothetical protein HMPREF1541_01363 [Cyphellophora europaea CBS 101466]
MSGPPVPFSSLPLSKTSEATRLNAWGAYGAEDEAGFLNRQTPETVAAAAAEIKTGVRVPLDAPLDFQAKNPLFHRQAFVKDVYQKKPRIVHDDTWTFNTQSSTQWDGLRHFGYQKAQRFYNDTTLEDIAGTSEKGKSNPNILGIHNTTERGGVTGRGILVDFARWAATPEGQKAVGGQFQNFETSAIKLEWLRATLAAQKTEVKWGDILIVRSGFFPAFHAIDQTTLKGLQEKSPPGLGGVEQSDQVLEWIWNNFSAVASDHPSFERWPTPYEWSMHEVLLAGWGCHIGEIFDLEPLSKECERQGRWSFFVSSVPTYVPGGVASPVNGVAIF